MYHIWVELLEAIILCQVLIKPQYEEKGPWFTSKEKKTKRNSVVSQGDKDFMTCTCFIKQRILFSQYHCWVQTSCTLTRICAFTCLFNCTADAYLCNVNARFTHKTVSRLYYSVLLASMSKYTLVRLHTLGDLVIFFPS